MQDKTCKRHSSRESLAVGEDNGRLHYPQDFNGGTTADSNFLVDQLHCYELQRLNCT